MDEDAVAQALARIKRAKAAKARTERADSRARDELHAAIADAFRVGARPAQVEEVSPYDRNHNARIRAEAGIPPTRPATVMSKKGKRVTCSDEHQPPHERDSRPEMCATCSAQGAPE